MGAFRAVVCLAFGVCSIPTIVFAQVELRKQGEDRVSITINGQPFSNFYIGRSYAKPFLAPLRAASGAIVSRQYPMENVAGESRDHPHHRGLWIGYGDINNVNFWENDPSSKPSADNPQTKGSIVLRAIHLEPGQKSGSITASFDWQAPGQQVLLEEHRKMTFSGDKDVRTIDVDVTFTAKAQVKFGDTKEGFFAIRVADSTAEKNSGLVTNSEGEQTEKNVWGRRADWADYGGTVDGQKVGIAIFDHPANFNHPPRWHVRAYGLFAVNPFGSRAFDRGASEGGDRMAAGESLRLLYRVVIHPGNAPANEIADWYAEYRNTAK